MEKIWKIANLFVATLRTIYLVHQYSHWTTKGPGFYGDHNMFERLYQSAQKDADLAAEKFIGLFGEAGVDFDTQTKLMAQVMDRYSNLSGDPVQISLAIEKEFLELANDAYEFFEKEGALTPGLDDMIMSIASNREEACYLLQQTAG